MKHWRKPALALLAVMLAALLAVGPSALPGLAEDGGAEEGGGLATALAAFPAETAERPAFHEAFGGDVVMTADNGAYRMYLSRETLILAVAGADGAVYYSSPPEAQQSEDLSSIGKDMTAAHLHVGYIELGQRSTGSVNSHLSSVRNNTYVIEPIADGVRITFDFSRTQDQFRIPVEYTLTGKGFDAQVVFSAIEEYGGGTLITSVTPLPYFGAALAGREGSILVPDGSGASIAFDSATSTSVAYSQPVYGRDETFNSVQTTAPTENIHLPVFGMYDTENAFCAVIDKGPALATITAMPAGSGNALNYVNAGFAYRGVDNAVLADASWISKNVTLYSRNASETARAGVSYRLMKNAGLMELAEEYRGYAVGAYGLEVLTEEENTLYLELYGGIKKKKSYFGIILDVIEPLTTFADARVILEGLREQGVDRITVKYNGTLKGGIDNSVVLDSKMEGALGGNKGYRALSEYAAANNVRLFADFEFQTVYKGRLFWSVSDLATRRVSQSPIYMFRYKRSTYFRDYDIDPAYLVAPARLSEEIAAFVDKETLPAGTGVGTGTMGGLLYSDFSSKRFRDRQMALETVAAGLADIAQSGRPLMVTGGNDYAAGAADVVFGAPVTDSLFDITAASVPFYSMVFHGYLEMASPALNMTEDPDILFLKCLENGIQPSLAMTWKDGSYTDNTPYNFLIGTKYSRWLEPAAAYYRQYGEAMDGTYGQPIRDYRILTDDVRLTEFGNGTRVYVNYGSADYNEDGVSVPARGYIIR